MRPGTSLLRLTHPMEKLQGGMCRRAISDNQDEERLLHCRDVAMPAAILSQSKSLRGGNR